MTTVWLLLLVLLMSSSDRVNSQSITTVTCGDGARLTEMQRDIERLQDNQQQLFQHLQRILDNQQQILQILQPQQPTTPEQQSTTPEQQLTTTEQAGFGKLERNHQYHQ